MNETIISIVVSIVTLAIAWQSYKLAVDQHKLRSKLKKMEDDLEDRNIQFSGLNGEIELVKKQYPDLELKDDWREESDYINVDGKKVLIDEYFKEPTKE